MKKLFIMLACIHSLCLAQKVSKPLRYCLDTTKEGLRCRSSIILKDGYCRVHSPSTLRCSTKTTKGYCKMPVSKAGLKCRYHG